MTNKFEQLLELLINEEQDKAEALFHEIVVEKSRDIYENLADSETTTEAMHDKKDDKKKDMKEQEVAETSEESKDETVEETAEESKDEEVKETSEESKEDEAVDEEVEIEDEATESEEKSEEESIEEVGGDATDELVKDISADQEGTPEMAADDMGKDMDADMDGDKEGDEDMEDRVVDLEDALDELKAEFEKMMADKKDGDDEDKDEAVEMPAETPAEEPIMAGEGKMSDKKDMKKEAMHGKDKKKMDEYKIQKSADTADHSDKGAKSPVNAKVKSMGGGVHNIAKSGAEEKGRPAPTAQKMSDFENSPGKDKGTSMKKEMKPMTADGSDKSAKSPINAKAN